MKPFLPILALIYLLFFIPLNNITAQALEIRLEKAVDLALESNLGLRQNQIDLAASGYSERRLWSEIFPTISATASAGFSDNLFSDNAAVRTSHSVGFGLNLGLNAGIPHVMRNIRLAHQANILRYEDARNQLAIHATRRFYSLIAEKNNLLVLEEALNLAQRQYQRNHVSFNNGLIRELTLIQSRLAYANARYALSIANTIYTNSVKEFLAILGLAADTEIALSGEINIVRIEADAEELIMQHLTRRPDITRARQEIERLENTERQITMQNRAPSLGLTMNWSSSSFDPFADTISGNANLSIPIDPWIPGTSRNQNVRRAGDSVEHARLNLQTAEQNAKTQIRSLTALLRNFWENITISRLNLEVSQLNYQLTEDAFRNGTVEFLVLEDARNNMANAQQRLLQAELTYFNMILDLSSAINMDWKKLKQTYGVIN